MSENGKRMVALVEGGRVAQEEFDISGPADEDAVERAVDVATLNEVPEPDQSEGSTVEIREWTGRRIYIDGKPAGQPFE